LKAQALAQSRLGTHHSKLDKLTVTGIIITLGIVYGDLGTSPLYVMKAIGTGLDVINKETIFGSISCIFWTLTLQTTIKYVIITLRADNKGEGGIFALFALLRKRYNWAYVFALIGGSTLLADGIITPSITVTSAVEGLKILHADIPVIAIVIAILSVLFFIQQFGTSFLGKAFGPLMFIWFFIIALWGFTELVEYPAILLAVNPIYAIQLLGSHPGAILILGAVFLATTGAEALYSDLGHCGLKNIRISWIYVKFTLLISYLGQAAWILKHPDFIRDGINPFFAIMPNWFIWPGIIIATIAAIIASQALISGSYTLISEAISLNLWPKMTIKYPTELKGQMYIPYLNVFLWAACIFVVILFKESDAMQAAYGLSITITMLMTTILLVLYLRKRMPLLFLVILGLVFTTIEIAFLYANLHKFLNGGWFTLLLGGMLAIMMYVWFNGRRIKNGLMRFIPISDLLVILKGVREDISIPKFATNIVYITKANKKLDIESTIYYSLLDKQPKRADRYWFLHLDIKDEPYTCEYEVTEFVKGAIFKIDFRIGFRIETQVNLFFRQVLDDLNVTDELKIDSAYPSLKKFHIPGDCRYVIIDRILTEEHRFNARERLIMNLSDIIKVLAIPQAKSMHLDASNIWLEKVPLGQPDKMIKKLTRVKHCKH